jgi:hypothetical protein
MAIPISGTSFRDPEIIIIKVTIGNPEIISKITMAISISGTSFRDPEIIIIKVTIGNAEIIIIKVTIGNPEIISKITLAISISLYVTIFINNCGLIPQIDTKSTNMCLQQQIHEFRF